MSGTINEHYGPVKVLIVDDHRMVVDGLRAILGQTQDVVILGEASSGQEAVSMAQSLEPDVVIMDISMPGMDGIEATRLIRKGKGHTQVLALTMYKNGSFVKEMMEAGARGFILKNTGRQELLEAIMAVDRGFRYLSNEIREHMEQEAKARKGGENRAAVGLTPREKEVVLLMIKDHSTNEIAEKLSLSTSTVETHRKNIRSKLGVHTIAALVKYAMERGWQA
jgi:two-component system, NarL family, nitrate/nitrite response regulator NarL